MNITRYEPWSLLRQLQKELEYHQSDSTEDSSIATAEWVPKVDIREQTHQFTIYADIPGVKPDDIEVSMESNMLTIKGQKESESKTEQEGYKRVERSFGSFHRRFNLPESANGEAISAKFKHGVLEITIPKREAEQPRRIAVAAEEAS